MSTSLSSLPPSRVPDPASAPPVRWGILGPGGIADKFTGALRKHTQQQVVAVGSRTQERADAFAAKHGIPAAYGSYAQLLADPAVQAVYVASPHSEHHAHALAAIAAGKHVLVEKAFTRSAVEAAAVMDAATSAGVMVMEAMWTRFLPHLDVVRQLLADGALGEVTSVIADHGQYFGDLPATHRLLNADLAGGALLDLGIYPVSLASFAMGAPESVAAVGTVTETGVDAQISIVLRRGRAQATLATTLLAETATVASIAGSAARVDIPGPFYAPQPIAVAPVRGARALVRDSADLAPHESAIVGHEGLCYQAAEFARCLAAGQAESPLMPRAETVAILATCDEIRRQVGVRYPGE